MSGTGLDAIVGLAQESSYGVYQIPDRHVLFNSENFNYAIPRVESPGIGDGARVERTDQWTTGRQQGAGDLMIDVANKGTVLFLTNMLGTNTRSTDGAGYHWLAKIGSLSGKSLSYNIGRPSTAAGVVQPFSYLGGKITAWRFTQQVEGFLSLALTHDFRQELTTATSPAASLTSGAPPTSRELFAWKTLAVTVAGSAFSPTGIDFGGTNPMKTDRFFLAGSSFKKEPLENAKRALTGTLTGEFEDMTQYNLFRNADPGTPGSMVPIVFTWTCVSTYDTAKPFKLVVTYNAARFEGSTPNAAGPDVLTGSWGFVGLADGSTEPVQIDLYTSDAS